MKPTITRDDVERRLRSTLRQKADQLAVPTFDFDVDAVAQDAPVMPMVDVESPSPRPRRRRTAVAVVAVAAVIVLVAAIVTQTSALNDPSPQSPGVRTQPGAGGVSATDGSLLAPSAVPDGMSLWSLNTDATATNPIVSTQLFGALDAGGGLAPGLLIEMQHASPGAGVNPGGSADATVRGHVVTVDPAKDGGVGTQQFAWIEGDAEVTVIVRGGTVAQAVAILDALKPRGTRLLDGFDPGSAPAGITQLGEAPRRSAPVINASFAYGHNAIPLGGTADLAVWTTVGGSYPGYLRTWMAGSRAADNVAVEFDPAVGMIVAWPDGRQAVASSSSLGQATLERVARSASFLEPAGARRLRDDLSRRLGTLPVLTSADLPSGTVALRGPGAPVAACLSVPRGGEPVCATPVYPQYQATARNGLAGSAVVNGQWLVFATATAEPVVYRTPPGPFSFPSPLAEALDAQRATSNGWHLALVEVPVGVNDVTVSTDGIQTSGVLSRPGAASATGAG